MTFKKNLSPQNSSQDIYLSIVGLKLVIYIHHKMLLSSSFCDQFDYIRVLVPGVTYLTHLHLPSTKPRTRHNGAAR